MQLKNYKVEIIKKKIKNIHIRVYPDLTIKVSAPYRASIKYVERVIFSKEKWILEQLEKYEKKIPKDSKIYASGEDHYYNGKTYILNVYESNISKVLIKDNELVMYTKNISNTEYKEKLMLQFYKQKLNEKLNVYISKWEKEMGVKINSYTIRKMKRVWGSCNITKKKILFNSELAKKTDEEIQLVVVHELTHLLEKNHNKNFKMLMTKFYPNWVQVNKKLNEIV